MAIELNEHQLKAIEELKTGSILCGGVGSGKSRTALAYYLFNVCKGRVKVNDKGCTKEMDNPRDLYIITTAMKRDSLEWDKECIPFLLSRDPRNTLSHVNVVIDSWNNIKKYRKVVNAFFIFDEQRLVGSGVWVKTFLNIARKNEWILLTATPGDQWTDYVPVFIANGFYVNKTEFQNEHCVFSRFSKYPKIERYIGAKHLEHLRDSILVKMEDDRKTMRHHIEVLVGFDRETYRTVYIDRWDPFDNSPIRETGKFMYLLRKVVNSDTSRITKVKEILKDTPKAIIFYNFTYELRMLETMCEEFKIQYGEYNGERHEELPKSERWVYLVQYTAGCEGWNCIETNAIIFYSQTYSYRMLEQACGRIDRMNTSYIDLYYYHLLSSAPIDKAIRRKLKDKKNFNESSFLSKNNSRRIHGL